MSEGVHGQRIENHDKHSYINNQKHMRTFDVIPNESIQTN